MRGDGQVSVEEAARVGQHGPLPLAPFEDVDPLQTLAARGGLVTGDMVACGMTQACGHVCGTSYGKLDGRVSPRPIAAVVQESECFPHVRVVRDYDVLRQVGRIRHRQYVQAQGKGYTSIAPEPECLIEPSDFSGVNVCAWDQDRITAGLRVGLVEDVAHPHRALMLRAVDELGIDPRLTVTCTRLVRDPEHRGTHAVDLTRFVRLRVVSNGYRYCLMQTSERLAPYFKRLEFTPTGQINDDPVAGRLLLMFLDTRGNPIQPRRGQP